MKVLVTGAAGFIGAAVSHLLLDRGDEVVGLDCLNDYYEVSLKQARLDRLTARAGFTDVRLDLADGEGLARLFADRRFDRVVHLAAQAGVRYSIENPGAYVSSNLVGFANVLEACRHHETAHLVYASSGSVYGANRTMPFSVHDNVDHPVSFYAATKKANELMAHTYSHLYGLPTTGVRFFTVYGPWGRPDMSPFIFVRRIIEGEPVDVFNMGHHKRDFTYIDDAAEGVVRLLDHVAAPDPEWSGEKPDPGRSNAPWRVYNLGSNAPVELLRYIEIFEDCVGKKAQKNLLPLQPGDVLDTFADVDDLVAEIGYRPTTPIEQGVARFVEWYRDYYGV